jgi:general L-amino acid transport system substrate-binding protein
MRNSASSIRLFAAALAVAGTAATASAGTLDTVKARGQLVCGVNYGLLGFAIADSSGRWSGFDVDFCRAVAAAIFGDAGKVEYVPLSAAERFDALKSSKIDLLARNSTWTMSRETEFGLTFVGTSYYDGQGFLVRRAANVNSALELGGSKVCVQAGTTTEVNLVDYFTANHMDYSTVVTASPDESIAAYGDNRCSVVTSDVSQLYALRQKLSDPGEHVILPEVISKEPLGPVVRQDDAKWATLVKWVHFALLDAEELGVGSATIDQALASNKPAVRKLVGLDGAFGPGLGLDKEWAVRMIRAVGNYGEIFDRNLGSESALGIPRGMNQLWNLGGIQYAPPIE